MDNFFTMANIYGVFGTPLAFFFALVLMAYFKFSSKNDPSLKVHRASHNKPTSRLGGVAVVTAVFLVAKFAQIPIKFEIFVSALPVFLMGIVEDLNKPLSPNLRLAVGASSASLLLLLQN